MATTPAHVSVGDLDVAVIAFTDNTPEYGATADSPGVACIECDIDDERTRERVGAAIREATDACPDLLVASLHWGPNMVEHPDERYEAFGRWAIDRGVDVVHGHSAHVLQGIEVYDGSHILYDTGDFVDDYRVDPELRNDRSFLFDLEVRPDGRLERLELHPVEIENCRVTAASPELADWYRERMGELSAPDGTTFEEGDEALVVEQAD